MKRKNMMKTAVLVGLFGLISGLAQAQIAIGHLADYSGGTSDIGKPFGEGEDDAIAFINKNDGVDGRKIDIETIDYGYQVPRALATYKKWVGRDKVSAILGWGTADTEALVNLVSKDQVPYISGSYSGALTDPVGKSERTEKPAPYNFFYGPSYSDAIRGLIQWAADDWKGKGKGGVPKYVHMGANHPYPNAPKAAGEDYARQLGFEILPAVQFPLASGDFTAQCLTLKQSGVNYAYLGNTAGSNVAVLKACKTAGVEVQFLGNVWGMDENALKAAGDAGNGVVFPLRTEALWGDDAPGMKLVREIARQTDPSGSYRSLHYLAGICTAYYLKEALEWAVQNGGAEGPNIKKAFYRKKNWVPVGLEGVCPAASWTEEDHRPTTTIRIYKTAVSGSTEGNLSDLMAKGVIKLSKAAVIELPRKAEWLGW